MPPFYTPPEDGDPILRGLLVLVIVVVVMIFSSIFVGCAKPHVVECIMNADGCVCECKTTIDNTEFIGVPQ